MVEVKILVEKLDYGFQATAFDKYGQLAKTRAMYKDRAVSSVSEKAKEAVDGPVSFHIEEM